MNDYKGYKTNIHCPECQKGVLRVLSSEEVLRMFPMSRAIEGIKYPESLKTQYWMHPSTGEMHEIWARPKYICVYCDICKHSHDMDERSMKRTKSHPEDKPKSYKIKGYGKYHR